MSLALSGEVSAYILSQDDIHDFVIPVFEISLSESLLSANIKSLVGENVKRNLDNLPGMSLLPLLTADGRTGIGRRNVLVSLSV